MRTKIRWCFAIINVQTKTMPKAGGDVKDQELLFAASRDT